MIGPSLGPPPDLFVFPAGDDRERAGSAERLGGEAWVIVERGEIDRGVDAANRALAELARVDDDRAWPWLRQLLGYAAYRRRDLRGAAAQLGAAFTEFEQRRDVVGMGRTLRLVGLVALAADDPAAGAAALGESLRLLATGEPDPQLLPLHLHAVAELARRLGDPETAIRLAVVVRDRVGGATADGAAEIIHEAGSRLDPAAVEAAVASGRALSLAEADRLARARCGVPDGRP